MMSLRLLAVACAITLAAPALAASHDPKTFLQEHDTNHDGQVPRAEFDTARDARFKATDANGDGWVSDAEYLSEYQVRLEADLARSDMTDEKKTEERQRQVRQTHVRFGVLDTNKNQRMEKAEYDVSGARAFAMNDADKNGVITTSDTAAAEARRTARNAETR
jgi:hypothetical protein